MKIGLAITLALLAWVANGQNSFFSQHNYAFSETSPAKIAIDNYASATLLYKDQKLADTDHLISTLLFVKYPIINHKNNRLALGISFTEKKIKGLGKLTEQLFASTLAYSFNYVKHAGISFAIDFGFVSNKINLNSIQTGSMWTFENGFDPSLSSGENLATDKIVHSKLNASLFWFVNDKNEDTEYYLGFSVFQLNKYKDSFYNEGQLTDNKQFVTLGGYRVYDKDQIAITPKFIVTSISSRSYVKLGLDFNYSLSSYKNNVSRKENSINVELNYQIDKGLQFGLQYLQPQYVVGMAYHVDLSHGGDNNVFNNAAEVLFVIRNPIEITSKKRKSPRYWAKKTKGRNQKSKKQPTANKNDKTPLNTIVKTDRMQLSITYLEDSIIIGGSTLPLNEQNLDTKSLEEKWETSVLLGAKNTLHFAYNSTQINENGYKQLKALAQLLKTYDSARIIIIGHTDNIGSTISNQAFSVKRAQAAAQVLKDLGVLSDKIISQGRGELEPLDTNLTKEGRGNNRRIEYYVINN